MTPSRNSRLCGVLLVTGLAVAEISAQQIPISRIGLMPNTPSPYLMRDWKEVAWGYDSLVFNTALSGQYLPLSKTYTAQVNYPGQTSFGLQSYVGGSLGHGEGINCIPAVVGATLAGIDKSNQSGMNWVLMCREWFNKANGQNVYLNSANTSTGNDWWYETMPNVFFYQLYSLYPSTTEFSDQFTAVADRWLAAINAMGGSTAPWSLANVNHRAFDLARMVPNNGSVVEPEAAGAIAWILYQAYVKTGDQRYRIGAEIALESLLVYTTNPSYELQLPYGVYVAARMNAEIGTTYDITKMLEWCFPNGDGTLRQWGVTVGNWGGYDCSGLIGEINHSNDYPFFMNTVEQAGALVPVVRYDDRYARAIGKWVLNAANASRLFYTNFLPDDHQDSEGWGHQYDPHSAIAHEALRQFNPSSSTVSPYATGDAITNGSAPTNYALYGASHVGIFAGLIDTTNVQMILRLDLRKTDYFHSTAYPTYLYYNPYSSDTSIVLDVGGGTHDLYNTVTKVFVRHGVSGMTAVTIPANSAAVVVVAPAGGSLTYDLDKTLVNGVIVDYRSGRSTGNRAPRIKSLSSDSAKVGVRKSVKIFCTATDRDGDTLSYGWSKSGGTLAGSGTWIEWTAPSVTGQYTVTCTVTDGRGGEAAATDTLAVVERTNIQPLIQRFTAVPRKLNPGGVSTIMCLASDANGDTVWYSWSSASGALSGTGRAVTWTAPSAVGNYHVRCRVDDGFGGWDLDSVGLEVRDLSVIQTGALVAYYPFNGNANDATGHGHDGTVNNAQLTNDHSGHVNSAYAFDGATGSIVVPNDQGLNFQNSMTVNFWMKAGLLHPNREQYPISHGNWQNRWKISVSPGSNKLRLTVKNSVGQIKDLDGETSLVTDSVYSVTGLYSGSDLELYLNGQLDAFAAFSGLINTTTSALTIGQSFPGDNNYNFNGVLDEIRIYDYALSLPEIASLVVASLNRGDNARVPAVYALEQNYPNPFNPLTTIGFQVPGDGFRDLSSAARNPQPGSPMVKLSVYDLLGREVAVLVNEKKAAGNYEVTWNASGIASGMYFFVMRAGDFLQTRKMLVLR
jgi:hypothetical protein